MPLLYRACVEIYRARTNDREIGPRRFECFGPEKFTLSSHRAPAGYISLLFEIGRRILSATPLGRGAFDRLGVGVVHEGDLGVGDGDPGSGVCRLVHDGGL